MSEGIHLESAVPTYTAAALEEKPYTFTVTNDGTVDADYELYLDNQGTVKGDDLMLFNFALKKDGKILKIDSLAQLSDPLLFLGTIHPGESSKYELYIWLDAINTAEDMTLLEGKIYQSAIRIESDQQKEMGLANSLARYDCNGKAECTRTVDDITYFQQGYYSNAFSTMKHIWYSGRMWIVTSYDSEGNAKAVTAKTQTYIPWGTNLDYQGSYVEHWLQNKFLPSLNNYEKFLVTDYVWNYSDEIQGEGDSDHWLIGNDKIVRSPIGILNKMDYIYGSPSNSAFDSNNRGMFTVLSNHNYMGTQKASGGLWTTGMGYLANAGYEMAGVSPSIVFKKDIIIMSGSGTLKDPYRLEGDESGKQGELLNTRYPGEYVAFGEGINSSYRISEIEDGKVKLISTNSLKSIEMDEYGDEVWKFLNQENRNQPYPYKTGSGDYLHYDGNSTDYPIAYFLNHEFLNPTTGYLSMTDTNMIATDQTFYTGTIAKNGSYMEAKDPSKAVTATVGLPILGETFNFPQSEEETSSTFFSFINDRTVFMTNDGTSLYHVKHRTRCSAGVGRQYSFRPTLYLKNTIKIKGGSGTKSDPYILQS